MRQKWFLVKVIRHTKAWLDEAEVVGLKSSLSRFDWLQYLFLYMS